MNFELPGSCLGVAWKSPGSRGGSRDSSRPRVACKLAIIMPPSRAPAPFSLTDVVQQFSSRREVYDEIAPYCQSNFEVSGLEVGHEPAPY